MPHSRAVLMDFDGALLGSGDAQADTWLRVLQDFGYAIEYGQVRARLGMGQDRILRELCGISEGSARGRRVLETRELLLRARLPAVKVLPNALAFLRRRLADGRRVMIATSASRSEAMALLGHAQLLTEFDHVICKEDAEQTKPAADVVRIALERAGIRPDNAIFVASSPYDLAAARGARVPSVALRAAVGRTPRSRMLRTFTTISASC